MPEKLASARKDLDKKKFGSALKKVEAALPKLEGEDQENGETIRAWIAQKGEGPMEQAAVAVRESRFYDAFLAYASVEHLFKGHAFAKQAKDASKAMLKDKTAKLEVKASEKFVEIQKEMRGERKPDDKLDCLKPLLSKKYAETLAGKEAAKIAKDLEAKVKAAN